MLKIETSSQQASKTFIEVSSDEFMKLCRSIRLKPTILARSEKYGTTQELTIQTGANIIIYWSKAK